jgi:two-component system, NtrC family, response regulator AtoC
MTTRARVLVFGSGPQARRLPLPLSGRITLGRSRDNFVSLPDDALASRRHAALHLGNQMQLEDLGSQNGTKLFDDAARDESKEGTVPSLGLSLPPNQPVPLLEGMLFQVGGTLLAVYEAPSAGAVEPTPLPPDDASVVVVDPYMQHLHKLLARVARRDLNVLLLGETGAGKDVLAQRLHVLSPRRKGPLVSVNCGALSENLLESELFGHEKGAFTGAVQPKAGLIEAANGGVLFLDEVGELSPSLQVKLLRVLEERVVRRVGGLRATSVDVRIVSATNRNLAEEAAAGRFRSDLYYRLDGISLTIPPLRERPSEIVPLALLMLARLGAAESGRAPPTLSQAAIELLLAHPWPGNVRELRNIMARALVLCEGPVIEPGHIAFSPSPSLPLPPPLPVSSRATPPAATERRTLVPSPPSAWPASGVDPLEPEEAPRREDVVGAGGGPRDGLEALQAQAEGLRREHILEVLASCGGNQTRAAVLLGINRRTLARYLERYGVPRPRGDKGG